MLHSTTYEYVAHMSATVAWRRAPAAQGARGAAAAGPAPRSTVQLPVAHRRDTATARPALPETRVADVDATLPLAGAAALPMASAASNMAHPLLATPGALAPLRCDGPKAGIGPPRVRGRPAEGTNASYWEWSKTHAPRFTRPGWRPVPKGKARFLAGRDGKPMGRNCTRHEINGRLATDEYTKKLGFRVPVQRPATVEMAKEGTLLLPGRRTVEKRRSVGEVSPSNAKRAQTPDGRGRKHQLDRSASGGFQSLSQGSDSRGLTDFSLEYLSQNNTFDGTRSELLPPSAPFSFMKPSGPLERERMRPPGEWATQDPTHGLYNLPRWPAYQLGGLEDSGTYASPERAGREAPRPPTPEGLAKLAAAIRGPKGLHEIEAAKNENKQYEEFLAASIHKNKQPMTDDRVKKFAQALPHKQRQKWTKPVEASKYKPRKRKTKPAAAPAPEPEPEPEPDHAPAEEKMVEVDGLERKYTSNPLSTWFSSTSLRDCLFFCSARA